MWTPRVLYNLVAMATVSPFKSLGFKSCASEEELEQLSALSKEAVGVMMKKLPDQHKTAFIQALSLAIQQQGLVV